MTETKTDARAGRATVPLGTETKSPANMRPDELDAFGTREWYATWRWLSRVVAKTARGNRDYARYLRGVSTQTDARLLALLNVLATECPDAYDVMDADAADAISNAEPLERPLRVNDVPIGSKAYARMNVIV